MRQWVKCTTKSGQTSYLNLSMAVYMIRDEKTNLTSVWLPNDEDPVRVKETPEELLRVINA